MLISSDAGGGQIVSSHDETRFYDDLGCLAADWAAHHDSATAFVRIAGGGWREARDASYARPAGLSTAMGSGIAAFATIADARAADRDQRALTFDDVVAIPGERR